MPEGKPQSVVLTGREAGRAVNTLKDNALPTSWDEVCDYHMPDCKSCLRKMGMLEEHKDSCTLIMKEAIVDRLGIPRPASSSTAPPRNLVGKASRDIVAQINRAKTVRLMTAEERSQQVAELDAQQRAKRRKRESEATA